MFKISKELMAKLVGDICSEDDDAENIPVGTDCKTYKKNVEGVFPNGPLADPDCNACHGTGNEPVYGGPSRPCSICGPRY